MTDEERAEVIDTFISIGEKFLKGNKHFHLEPILARDTIQAIKELGKENEELKKEISVLLSCANCQENKGGYVCEKEYNDKCLAQKIEYIKELKKEISELKEKLNKKDCEDCFFYAEGDKCNKGVYYASGTSVCKKFVFVGR